jgi:hypothetical protein
MDVVEEIVGDEIVANKPNEVGQEDQQRQCDSRPEPAVQLTYRRARVSTEAAENSGDVKHDGVLGQQSQCQ